MGIHKLPAKWTGYTQFPHPRNVRKVFSLAPRVPDPRKPASPPVDGARLYQQPEVRSEIKDSLKSLVPVFGRLRTEADLERFVTEKKRAKLDSAVWGFTRPQIQFSKSKPNRASPVLPFTNNEIYDRERLAWESSNPKKLEIAKQRDERDREQLEKKRRAKYPLHFSETKELANTETQSETTRTTYSLA